MDNFILSNGVEMPKEGMGTYLIDKDNLPNLLMQAYDMGYRKFDTAWRYKNERIITDTLFKKNGIKREDVFITTKVNQSGMFLFGYHGTADFIHRAANIRYRGVKKAIQASFDNLGLEYVDLFLVHAACTWYLEMYEELTRLYKQGRIRAIGVSSFLPPHIESLKEVSDVVPMVNQFEISPLNTQKDLIQYCKDNSIVPEAMSTLSHYHSNEVRKEIVENGTIVNIANKHQKSPAQIVWRWLYQQGVSIIPKSRNVEHLKENISIYDFELSAEEMASIDKMDGGKFLNYDIYPKLQYLPEKYQGWKGFK